MSAPMAHRTTAPRPPGEEPGSAADRRVVRAGTFRGGLPFLTFGSGPLIVVLPGLEGANENPTGRARSGEVLRYRALADRFTVVVVRRPPGLPVGTTMADLAAAHADAFAAAFGRPVDVVGVSTGGSVALQLAVDHPDAVRRLVLWASASRLSDGGRALQREVARHLREGRQRAAWATSAPALATGRVGRALAGVALRLQPRLDDRAVSDMLRTIEAEDVFDLTARLGRVRARALVVGGARDPYYGADLFRRTAAGIPGGRLRLHPRRGHGGTVMSARARDAVIGFLAAPPPG